MEKTIEIPEGYEARIGGNKVILEQKESEDEGIRKFIIYCIDELRKANAENAEFNGRCSESIAYLEKQKENPKNADFIPVDCVSSAKCENEHNKPGDFVFELRQIISRHRYADMYGECVDDEEGMAREILSLCEKQKEQKSINSFDIVPYIDDKIAALQDMWREEKVAFDWDDMHEMIEDVARHFYQKEQKPAEWSEEDERILKGIIGLIDHDQHYGVSNNEMISWLKSLRPQPHWKPSEEQMRAVFDASERNDKLGSILRNLYNDLKKL